MRFQLRDGQFFRALYKYGVLARRQIKQTFWPDAKSSRAMDHRLHLMAANDYVTWPTRDQYKTEPIPEPIVYLGWRGILWIAAQEGVEVKEPTDDNENQLRLLQKRLRANDIHWVREPRFRQLLHDLAVIDIQLAVEQELAGHPVLSLEESVSEREFRAQTDVVSFAYTTGNGVVKRGKKGVLPDWYAVIANEDLRRQGKLHRARFLVEYDNATHPNPRFARDKIAAAAAYIQSPQYKVRFSVNSGHWLIVAKSSNRLRFLMQSAQGAIGKASGLFYFTTLDAVERGHPLTSPIWLKLGWRQPASLPVI